MRIEKAVMQELDLIMEKYAQARTFMAAHGNPDQWGQHYPDRELVSQDIREGCAYVCRKEEKIVGVFYYKYGPDETYREIWEGEWLSDAPYGVVHRITSDGTVKGTASFCLEWALRQCKNLRIDTHRDNIVMQNLLKKNGFSYCGVIRVREGERLAYQKQENG